MKNRLKIDSISGLTNYRTTITGTVKGLHNAVQVFVFSNDGALYKQTRARVHGRNWKTTVTLGYSDSFGKSYAIVATTGKHIAPAKIEALPADVTSSNWVVVTRAER